MKVIRNLNSRIVLERQKMLRQFEPNNVKKLYKQESRKYAYSKPRIFSNHQVNKHSKDVLSSQVVSPMYLGMFYYQYNKPAKVFSQENDRISSLARKLRKAHKYSLEEELQIGRQYLESTQLIIQSFKKVDRVKPSLHPVAKTLIGYKKMVVKTYIKKLKSEKGEGFREAVRSFIPRWLRLGITYPDSLKKTSTNSYKKWQQTIDTSKDLILIHPEYLKKGLLPFHLAMEIVLENPITEASKAGGEILEQILTFERNNYETELDYFLRMILSTVSSTSSEPLTTSDSPNYVVILNKFWDGLFELLTFPIHSHEYNLASQTLRMIYEFDPDLVTNALALGMENRYALTPTLIDIVKNLHNTTEPWSQHLFETYCQLEKRYFLWASEINKLFSQTKTDEDISSQINLLTDLLQHKTYSHSFDISQHTNCSQESSTFIEVLIQNRENTKIQITLTTQRSDIQHRSLVFMYDHQQRSFVPNSTLISTTEEKKQLEININNVVTDCFVSIVDQLEKIQSNQQADKAKKSITHTSNKIQQTKLSRDERVERYKNSTKKPKKRTASRSNNSSTDSLQADIPQIIEETFERRIINLDIETVSSLLAEADLKQIKPELCMNKINKQVELSNHGKRMLGKKIKVQLEKIDKHAINLRQLNWVLDGGRMQIRMYLEDQGEGKFWLHGIMLKKGLEQQNSYIKKLVTKILKNRA